MTSALVLAGSGVAGIAWEVGMLHGVVDHHPGLTAALLAPACAFARLLPKAARLQQVVTAPRRAYSSFGSAGSAGTEHLRNGVEPQAEVTRYALQAQ